MHRRAHAERNESSGHCTHGLRLSRDEEYAKRRKERPVDTAQRIGGTGHQQTGCVGQSKGKGQHLSKVLFRGAKVADLLMRSPQIEPRLTAASNFSLPDTHDNLVKSCCHMTSSYDRGSKRAKWHLKRRGVSRGGDFQERNCRVRLLHHHVDPREVAQNGGLVGLEVQSFFICVLRLCKSKRCQL